MNARKIPVHTIAALALVILVYCPFNAQAELQEEMSSENWSGKVDWQEGYIYASAIGTADMAEMVNEIQAEQVSKVTATHLAYRALYEMIGKIGLDATSIYRKQLMVDDILKIETQGELENVQIWKYNFSWTPHGSPKAIVTVRMSMQGGLSRSAANWANRQPDMPRFESDLSSGDTSYTGLIVDARDIGLQPCMCPKILTNEGRREVYGPGLADPDKAGIGFAAYTCSVEEARKNQRAGRNPLVIKATGSHGIRKGDVVISENDAVSVLRADLHNNILKECRVIIVAK